MGMGALHLYEVKVTPQSTAIVAVRGGSRIFSRSVAGEGGLIFKKFVLFFIFKSMKFFERSQNTKVFQKTGQSLI